MTQETTTTQQEAGAEARLDPVTVLHAVLMVAFLAGATGGGFLVSAAVGLFAMAAAALVLLIMLAVSE